MLKLNTMLKVMVFSIAFLPVLSAQSTISGLVQDAEGQAMAYANVLLLNASDSILLKGEITGENGNYTINRIPEGQYLVNVSMVGFEDIYSDPISLSGDGQPMDMPVLVLATASEALSEVQVVAKKPLFEQQIDRTIVNVQASITSAGGTALDVLEKSPGIIVNRQNGSISMAGKDGVVIMINEKENRMPVAALVEMLAGMSANSIERIELITTPPARYDAEGNAGIINIVMLQSSSYGVNGNYNVFGGYGLAEKFGGGLNFNARSNQVNVFGDFSFSRDRTIQKFGNARTVLIDDQLIGNSSLSDRDATRDVINGRLGVDIELSKKTVLGFLASGYDSRWDMDAFNDVEQTADGIIFQTQGIANTEINHWQHLSGNVNLQHKFGEGKQINADIDYLHFIDNNPTTYNIEFFDPTGALTFSQRTRAGKRTPIHVGIGKVDYSNQVNEKLKIEGGIKASIARFSNAVDVAEVINGEWVQDPILTQEYQLQEEIGALYATGNWQITEKTGLNVGLRYEYTMSNLGTLEQADIVDRKYGYLFPSVFISHNLNEDHGLNMSFSRRIQRPTYNDLAPFIIFLYPNTFFTGNAALQPGLTNAISASYRFKSYFLQLSYSYDEEPIARFQPDVDAESNVLTVTSVNLEDRHSVNLSLTLPITLTKWWSVRFNKNLFWQQTNAIYQGSPVSTELVTFGMNGTSSFTLPRNFGVEVSGFYFSSGFNGLVKWKPAYSIDVGLQKKFDNGAALRINMRDVFNTINWIGEANQPELNLISSNRYDIEGQILRVTWSQPFGNKKIKGNRNRQTGGDEERQRVEN
ncbi:MAG: outer membrane beta-barrel family protein [Bacteroidota bacterium]